MYGFSVVAINLRSSRNIPNVPMLCGTPVMHVSANVQKLPNITGKDISELDAHLAQTHMRLTTMGIDLKTKQASSILVSSFIEKLGHWAQHNIEALYIV
jgi:hypothetical protein